MCKFFNSENRKATYKVQNVLCNRRRAIRCKINRCLVATSTPTRSFKSWSNQGGGCTSKKWIHSKNYISIVWITTTTECKQVVTNSTKPNLTPNRYYTCWLGNNSKWKHNQQTIGIHNSYSHVYNTRLFSKSPTCSIICDSWWKIRQTHPWVVPLRTSHPKILRRIQLQNNIWFT